MGCPARVRLQGASILFDRDGCFGCSDLMLGGFECFMELDIPQGGLLVSSLSTIMCLVGNSASLDLISC